ncbi:MAG: hypothetical protein KUG77_18485 [Nannocystaceae bacterium]|nr:hypothetical protein [Nannocystaceae bacterium]
MKAQAARSALKERIESLETALARIDAKLDVPVAPPTEPIAVKPGRPDPTDRYWVPVGRPASRGLADAKVSW